MPVSQESVERRIGKQTLLPQSFIDTFNDPHAKLNPYGIDTPQQALVRQSRNYAMLQVFFEDALDQVWTEERRWTEQARLNAQIDLGTRSVPSDQTDS